MSEKTMGGILEWIFAFTPGHPIYEQMSEEERKEKQAIIMGIDLTLHPNEYPWLIKEKE